MTAPENLVTHQVSIDRLRYRVPTRDAGSRSNSRFNTLARISRFRLSTALLLTKACSPPHPSRFAPVQPAQRYAAPIEIP
jgi:hypothetical protein